MELRARAPQVEQLLFHLAAYRNDGRRALEDALVVVVLLQQPRVERIDAVEMDDKWKARALADVEHRFTGWTVLGQDHFDAMPFQQPHDGAAQQFLRVRLARVAVQKCVGPQHDRDQVHRRALRDGGRARDEKALAAGNAQVAHGGELGLGLDALGDELRLAGLGQLVHRPHELEFHRIVGDAADEVAVDLDEFGPHLGPHSQVGKSLSQIVDGDLESATAIGDEQVAQRGKIGDLVVFGDFDDDLPGRQPQRIEQLRGLAVEEVAVAKAGGADVDEQPSRQAQAGVLGEHRLAAEAFQFEGQPCGLGDGKKHLGRMQRTAQRPADQALETEVGTRAEIEDGLEDGCQQPLFEDGVQRSAAVVVQPWRRLGAKAGGGGAEALPLQGVGDDHAVCLRRRALQASRRN